MRALQFLALSVLFIGLTWIVLSGAYFLLRAVRTSDPQERMQHSGPGFAILQILLSLAVGVWLAWRLVLA